MPLKRAGNRVGAGKLAILQKTDQARRGELKKKEKHVSPPTPEPTVRVRAVIVAPPPEPKFSIEGIKYGREFDPVTIRPSGVGQGHFLIATTTSRRYRTDETVIPRMPAVIDALKPIRSRWKNDPNVATPGDVDYDIIAEDLASVWPEAVIYDENGRISNVRRNWLFAIMLKEIQYLRRILKEKGIDTSRE